MHVASTYNTQTNFPDCMHRDFVGIMFELENRGEFGLRVTRLKMHCTG